ncbi:MAG: hypothetical protein LEGION0403_FIIPPAGN_01464 [Legionella sp.]
MIPEGACLEHYIPNYKKIQFRFASEQVKLAIKSNTFIFSNYDHSNERTGSGHQQPR